MINKRLKLEKYLLVNEKYHNKFRELAIRYTKAVCKAIGAEYVGYFTDTYLFQHIKYKDKEYQAGGFAPYFYNSREDLKEVLEKEIIDAEKTFSKRCKKDSKKV